MDKVIIRGERKAPTPLSKWSPFIQGARLSDRTQTRRVLHPTTTRPAPIPLRTVSINICMIVVDTGMKKNAVPVNPSEAATTGLPLILS